VVGLVVVTGREVLTVIVFVGLASGVMGRLVGVEVVVWGSWQARVARMSRIRMGRRGQRRDEIMQAIITLLVEQAV
jgi:hypothetical protein